MIEYHNVTGAGQLDALLGKSSHHNDFVYKYELETINLLKRYFEQTNSLYLFATESDVFAGFVSCDSDWWEEKSFFLRELFVDPGFQSIGIGSSLVQRCIDHASKHGATTLVTQTAFANFPMQKLCESANFERWENPRWNKGITYKLSLK